MGRNEDRQKILQMLAKGTITVEEADQLLGAMGEEGGSESVNPPPRAQSVVQPKYLRVMVEPKGEKGERVNIRIPFQLIRAGAKFAAFIPQGIRSKVDASLKDKGMDFDLANLTPENLESFVDQLSDLAVDVDGQDESVRIFCE